MAVRFDHLVLTVSSIDDTCAFYGAVLDARTVRFGAGRVALDFDGWKINLHEAGREFEPKAMRPTPGSGDFCVLTDRPLDTVVSRLLELGIVIEEGPVARTGATGPIRSVYIRDPDGNLVEIANVA